MSWLFFIDECGHDHRSLPYEIWGGIALQAKELWSFVQNLHRLELSIFGTALSEFGHELKGWKLLDKDRFRWANQMTLMPDEERRKYCRKFLTKGLEKQAPNRLEFTAYGQACLEMARNVFQLLRDHKAVLFASAIPKGVKRPANFRYEFYLRKDHVFLLERFFFFLERTKDDGLLVLDEVERSKDIHFVKQLEGYFGKTQQGRYRTSWIVPTPFFVASDMTYPIQVSDICIYCVAWGFRLPSRGMNAPVRKEIADEFGPWINQLQFRGEGYRDGETFPEYGIVYVVDPYTAR